MLCSYFEAGARQTWWFAIQHGNLIRSGQAFGRKTLGPALSMTLLPLLESLCEHPGLVHTLSFAQGEMARAIAAYAALFDGM